MHISESISFNKNMLTYTVFTGCQQQHTALCPNTTQSGCPPLEIAQEGGPIPFTGIPRDAQPDSMGTYNISEGYNPVSTKGLLEAVKVNEKVVLSPDGQSVTAPDSKLSYMYIVIMCTCFDHRITI